MNKLDQYIHMNQYKRKPFHKTTLVINNSVLTDD